MERKTCRVYQSPATSTRASTFLTIKPTVVPAAYPAPIKIPNIRSPPTIPKIHRFNTVVISRPYQAARRHISQTPPSMQATPQIFLFSESFSTAKKNPGLTSYTYASRHTDPSTHPQPILRPSPKMTHNMPSFPPATLSQQV